MAEFISPHPRLVRRKCGGWLAVSADADSLKIGVFAATEDQVKAKFAATAEAWARNLASEPERSAR